MYMTIKKLFRKLFDRCIHCGCPNFDYSSKKSYCPCGCGIEAVTKEAEIDLSKIKSGDYLSARHK